MGRVCRSALCVQLYIGVCTWCVDRGVCALRTDRCTPIHRQGCTPIHRQGVYTHTHRGVYTHTQTGVCAPISQTGVCAPIRRRQGVYPCIDRDKACASDTMVALFKSPACTQNSQESAEWRILLSGNCSRAQLIGYYLARAWSLRCWLVLSFEHASVPPAWRSGPRGSSDPGSAVGPTLWLRGVVPRAVALGRDGSGLEGDCVQAMTTSLTCFHRHGEDARLRRRAA